MYGFAGKPSLLIPETVTLKLSYCEDLRSSIGSIWASLVAQTVKSPPAMQKTWVRSLGWEDPLEEGMATHSSILLENSYGQRSLSGYSPWGPKELDTTE